MSTFILLFFICILYFILYLFIILYKYIILQSNKYVQFLKTNDLWKI